MRRFFTILVFTEIEFVRSEVSDFFWIIEYKILGFVIANQHFPDVHGIIVQRKAVLTGKFSYELFGRIVLSQAA